MWLSGLNELKDSSSSPTFPAGEESPPLHLLYFLALLLSLPISWHEIHVFLIFLEVYSNVFPWSLSEDSSLYTSLLYLPHASPRHRLRDNLQPRQLVFPETMRATMFHKHWRGLSCRRRRRRHRVRIQPLQCQLRGSKRLLLPIRLAISCPILHYLLCERLVYSWRLIDRYLERGQYLQILLLV